MEFLLVVIAGLLWVLYTAIARCAKHLANIESSAYRQEDRAKEMVEYLQRVETAVERLHQDVTEIRYVTDDVYKLDIKPRKVY